MTVRIADEAIHLEGRCLVEDAEALLLAIQQYPETPIDMAGVQRLHLAVAQVLLVLKPPVVAMPTDHFLSYHVLNGRLHSDKPLEMG